MKRDVQTDGLEPAYLETWKSGKLEGRIKESLKELEACRMCPRICGVARNFEERGICQTGRKAIVASSGPHHGEEACLSGTRGSGTIFFAQCNLRCVFCQNHDISQTLVGAGRTAEELAEMMLQLQEAGCHNLNLVTPEHVVPEIIEALAVAIPEGLRIPLVYNASGYDAVASLELMEGLVDIYMPDFKLWSKEASGRLLTAPDYPARTRDAIFEMNRQVGELRLDSEGIARRGLLVRHLVMPGMLQEAEAIFDWLAKEISPDTVVNVMGQYRPEHFVGGTDREGETMFAEANRPVTPDEVEAALEAARAAGLHRFA